MGSLQCSSYDYFPNYTRRHNYIILALKQTIFIVILLLVCYTRTYTDCLFSLYFSFILIYCISCVLATAGDGDDDYDDDDTWFNSYCPGIHTDRRAYHSTWTTTVICKYSYSDDVRWTL